MKIVAPFAEQATVRHEYIYGPLTADIGFQVTPKSVLLHNVGTDPPYEAVMITDPSDDIDTEDQ